MATRGHIGDYTILGTVGVGGMGAVLKVRHRQMGVIRAVKVMARPNDLKAQARFERESRNLAGVSHPNLIKIHEASMEPGRAWFAMDLVEGQSLRDRIGKSGGLEWRDAVEIMIGVCRGVAALHAVGVLHRDLKPSNIMINEEGRPIVIDLGLALSPSTDERLTRTGAVVGTLRYLPPEAVVGAEPAPSADVYALGLILYELLTGESAVPAQSSWQAQTAAILTESRPAPGVSAAGLPASIDDACVKAMYFEPSGRFADAGVFADALTAALHEPGPTREQAKRRIAIRAAVAGMLLPALLVALVVLVQGWAAVPAPPPSTPTPTSKSEAAHERPILGAKDRREAQASLKDLRGESDRFERIRLANVWLERFSPLPQADSVRRLRSTALFKGPLVRVDHEGGSVFAAIVGADRLVTVGRKGVVKLWSYQPIKLVRSWTLGFVSSSAALAPDGRTLLIGGTGGTFARLDLPGATLERLSDVGSWVVNDISFSADGRFASIAHNQFVDIYAVSEAKLLVRLSHESHAQFGAFSPDGARVATGSGRAINAQRPNDLALRMWELPSGKPLFKRALSAKVTVAQFNHDGTRLAVGTGAAQLLILDGANGETLGQMSAATPGEQHAVLLHGNLAHSFTVRGIAFSLDERLVFSCSPKRSGGGELRIWDAQKFVELLPSRTFIRPPLTHQGRWEGMTVSRSADRVALWDREGGGVEVWALPD